MNKMIGFLQINLWRVGSQYFTLDVSYTVRRFKGKANIVGESINELV